MCGAVTKLTIVMGHVVDLTLCEGHLHWSMSGSSVECISLDEDAGHMQNAMPWKGLLERMMVLMQVTAWCCQGTIGRL